MADNMAMTTYDETAKLSRAMVQSGFFKDSKTASQAVVKILAGRELGIGPVRAMNDVYVIEGKTALSYSLIGALIKQSGRYNYRIKDHSDQGCTIEFFEGSQSVGVSTFTIKDAERAGLAVKPIWKQYPRNMVLARAMSNGARMYTPDVFGGSIYTPDELDMIDAEWREVPSAPDAAQAPRPEPPQGEPIAKVLTAVDRAQRAFWAKAKDDFPGKTSAELKEIIYSAFGIASFNTDWLGKGKTWGDAIDYLDGLAGRASKATAGLMDRLEEDAPGQEEALT